MHTLFTIDNGNSNPQVAVFRKDRLEKIIPLNNFAEVPQGEYHFMLSNVGKDFPLRHKIDDHLIDTSSYLSGGNFLDMPINYSSTLGDDRLFQTYFIFKKMLFLSAKANKILLIDAGTFTTVDLISKNGYQGGLILPGIQTFLESYKKGNFLPALSTNDVTKNHKLTIPHNTFDCLSISTNFFIQSSLKALKDIFPQFDKIIITGGNANYYHQLLQNMEQKTELIVSPNLIHESMLLIFSTRVLS